MTRTVAVLMGGISSEREVSLVTGEACAAALARLGWRVARIDAGPDTRALVADLQDAAPDVVFNALHGRFGEDGCVQGVLELLGVPYTHCGVTASALAMDKPMAKRLFAAAGLPVADHRLVRVSDLATSDNLSRPCVVKPLHEGSSVGVRVLLAGDDRPAVAPDWPFGDTVMVEQFVPGRELTVSVMDGRPLGVTEIRTHRGFYDYDAKYAEGGSQHDLPADVPDTVAASAQRLAVRAHDALGCRGVTRADLRWEGEGGDLYLLEVNTQPGMTPTSLVPEQAAHAGMGFDELVAWMVEDARCGG